MIVAESSPALGLVRAIGATCTSQPALLPPMAGIPGAGVGAVDHAGGGAACWATA